ncbi:MAG TPA: hypothetical protein VFI77_09080 [Gemmatimonadales bacterium]|nr:hypothetical protein [Gemmatimonadales bacterium]
MCTIPFIRKGVLAIGPLAILACSSDSPLGPSQDPQPALATAAPTIALTVSPLLRSLCYPPRRYSTRGCPSGASVSIRNSGSGTLQWTTSKSAAWIRKSPASGTAPSTLQIWVDGSALPPGSYSGYVKVWAQGATNSPQSIYVHVTRD